MVNKIKFSYFGVVIFFCACSATENRQYRDSLSIVKSVATPGRDIHLVKSDLESKGYEVSKPYDPTDLGKVLWMNVSYGSTPGVIDGVLYASGLPDKKQPSSIIVKANFEGVVIGVKD
jgi:hypothetical protein